LDPCKDTTNKRAVVKTYKLADNCFFAWWILSFRTFLYQVVNALAFLYIVYKTVRAVQAAGCCETTDNIQNIENGPKIFEKSYLIQFSIKLILFPPSIEWCKFGFTIHNSCYPIWSNLKKQFNIWVLNPQHFKETYRWMFSFCFHIFNNFDRP